MREEYDDRRIPAAPVDSAYAQARPEWEEGKRRGGYRRVLSAATLVGHHVRNQTGEDLGKVEEIMVDVPTGQIAYVVISFGGFLGIGDKLFAVPWRALSLNERDRLFLLDVDRRQLEEAPGFDRDHWPDMADPAWAEQMDDFYSYRGRA